MNRTRLQINSNKSKNPIDIVKFKWQRNLVANLNKHAKLQYFEKLSVDGNSKSIWKACKPYFSNRNSNIQENLMLLEKDKFLPKQKDVTENFNERFGSTADSSSLFNWSKGTKMLSGNKTINSNIKKLGINQSIKAIKKKLKIKSKFSFNHVLLKTIKRVINDLDIKKSYSGEILTYCFEHCHSMCK